ncbi:MAG: glycosyltransferase [Bacteroidales bacterium]|nr:glycosyltransferase [Bacteroidales bacterium]
MVWSGIFQGRKALPLLLFALSQVSSPERFQLIVLGDGSEAQNWKALSTKLHLNNIVTWIGKIPHRDALNIMQQCDALIFTSLQEATSTVVLEALESGLPVVCHDMCGFGTVITKECGIKIPVVSPKQSIKQFSLALEQLSNPAILAIMKEGARKKASQLTWNKKAQKMVQYYYQTMQTFKK